VIYHIAYLVQYLKKTKKL
jgi:hypothetical protein